MANMPFTVRNTCIDISGLLHKSKIIHLLCLFSDKDIFCI